MCLSRAIPPLTGVRIVDFSRILAGPYCTQILADLGATVFKIERPKIGDDTRQWKPPNVGKSELSCYFASVNRNKMSVVVDLKRKRGISLLKSLIKTSDILVENFLPGTMDRLGLGFQDLVLKNPSGNPENVKMGPLNPKLVYATITGYGQSGPWKNRGGYDVIASALGGLMHITGERDGPPCKAGVAVTDLLTGALAHGAILAALAHAQRTGQGQRVDCNLLATQVSMLANIGSNWLNAKVPAKRWGTGHESIVPYQAFESKDARWFIVGGGNDSLFKQVCGIIGMPELSTDSRFLTNSDRVKNRNALLDILFDAFRQKTLDEWDQLFSKSTVPFGPINDMEAVFQHPQVKHLDLVKTLHHPVTGPVKVVGPPIQYSVSKNCVNTAPPILGEHTSLVLENELGMEKSEIDQLKSDGVIDFP